MVRYVLLTFVLAFGLLLRIYKIDNPIADWHSWRQADTASVAKTYVSEGINLAYPRYHDISSVQTGIFNPLGYRFVEFPIYQALAAFFYGRFGLFTLEIWLRVLSITASLVCGYILYLLGGKFINRNAGLLAAFFYLAIPFNVYFTRAILPESMATMTAIVALWFFVQYIEQKKVAHLLVSSLTFSLAILIKPYVFFYGVPVLYLFFRDKGKLREIFKWKYLASFFLLLAPFLVWRFWINRFPEGIPFWHWAFNGDKIRFKPAFWRWLFSERLGTEILGTWGVVFLAFSFLGSRKGKMFVAALLLGVFVYFSLVATANVRHDYYQAIAMPALALAMADGALKMWRIKVFNSTVRKITVIFIILLVLIISGHVVKGFYNINHPEIIKAGFVVDSRTPKDALVIAPYNGDTAFLYQTGRWGWPFKDREIEELIDEGADYYVSVNFDTVTKEIINKYEVIESNSSYVVVDLKHPTD